MKMSLNRYEQLLHDYIGERPEERRFWEARVQEIAGGSGRREEATLNLNAQLWDYFEERARHERKLGEVVPQGSGKVSLLNLSEYLLRMWAPLPVARKSTQDG